MNAKELLKQNFDEYAVQCLAWDGTNNFLSFLKDRKKYTEDLITELLVELLNNNTFILSNNEVLDSIANFAVSNNYADLLKKLIKDYGVDPSSYDGYFLRHAVKEGFTKTVEVLLDDSRVNPGGWYNYYIKIAIDRKFTEILILLLIKCDEKLTVEEKKKISCVFAGNNDVITLLDSK